MSTYRRIGAVKITLEILRFLSDQRGPVSGREVARALELKYDTVMCHLATLEDDRFASRTGECFQLGQDAALIWAKRKTQLESMISSQASELRELEV